MPKQISRRDFLKLISRLGLHGALSVGGGWFYAASLEPAWVETVDLRLTLPRLPRRFSGLRLAQISDLHIGAWMTPDRLDSIVETVLALKPDVIAVSGDFASHYHNELFETHYPGCVASLKRLAQQTFTFAVLGNHDHWVGASRVRRLLANSGIHELRNDVFSFGQGEDALHFCGIDDVWDGNDDLPSLLGKIPAGGCGILLAHAPDFADTSAPTRRFDIQLSGHSPGGQVIVPFLGPPILPHGAKKYPLGLYQVMTMYQYTNRGLGLGFLPYRINCRPEITLLTLESTG